MQSWVFDPCPLIIILPLEFDCLWSLPIISVPYGEGVGFLRLGCCMHHVAECLSVSSLVFIPSSLSVRVHVLSSGSTPQFLLLNQTLHLSSQQLFPSKTPMGRISPYHHFQNQTPDTSQGLVSSRHVLVTYSVSLENSEIHEGTQYISPNRPCRCGSNRVLY